MEKRLKYGLSILVLLGVMTAGCIAGPRFSSTDSLSKSVDLKDADSVNVDLRMGAGSLEIQGGAEALMEGNFRYSHHTLVPDISYRVRSSGVGQLRIEQEDGPRFQDHVNYKNEWDIFLNDEVPIALDLSLGAGESTLDLGDLNLESFTMQIGAGEAYVDLGGYSGGDLDLDIQGGVGELTVILPASAQIRADVAGGLGELNVDGLYRENGLYLNENDGDGPVFEVKVETGIGQLNLIVR